MGRGKGQAEKIEFKGLKPVDLAFLVRHGEAGLKDRFLGIARAKEWLESCASNAGARLDPDEIDQMTEALESYRVGLLLEIDRRLEELNGEMASLERAHCKHRGDLERGKKQRAEREELKDCVQALQSVREWVNSDSIGRDDPDESQRLFVLVAYRRLQRDLGRRPFRRELESVPIKTVGREGRMEGRAISRSAERMGLVLGDPRIRDHISKEVDRRGEDLISQLEPAQRAEILGPAISNLKIKSPEANWMRAPLAEADFENLIDLVGDKNLGILMEEQVESSTTVRGRKFEFSEQSVKKLKTGDRLEFTRAIRGAPEVYCLLQALRAFSNLWNQNGRWQSDLGWLLPGGISDYSAALDHWLLSLSLTDDTCRDPALWVWEMMGANSTRTLLRSVWIRAGSPENTPQAAEEVETGVDRLFRTFGGGTREDSRNCAYLSALDCEFRTLVAFLEPFYVLLKAREYGF